MHRSLNIVFLFLLCASEVMQGQTFADFITQINATEIKKRQALLDSFVGTVPSFPLTEDTLAHFIYQGPGDQLAVAGDFSTWNPEHAPMMNVAGTDFWHRTEIFESDARLDYQFVRNPASWMLDPRNPLFVSGGFGNNSELRMPSFVPPVEIQYFEHIPHGKLLDTTFTSINLGNSREIKIYLPPGYDEGSVQYPVILMHDGLEYLSFAKMNNVVDYLLSQKAIEPVIVVFAPPVERSLEYLDAKKAAFTKFIVKELMPWVDLRFRTKTDPNGRAVAGSSLGGNISLWIGMNHPEVFGKVGAFSSFIESAVQSHFESVPRLDLQIYMNHGKYDHLPGIHKSVNGFIPILEAKGYNFEFNTYPEGHSYGLWRGHLDDMLLLFFPR